MIFKPFKTAIPAKKRHKFFKNTAPFMDSLRI